MNRYGRKKDRDFGILYVFLLDQINLNIIEHEPVVKFFALPGPYMLCYIFRTLKINLFNPRAKMSPA